MKIKLIKKYKFIEKGSIIDVSEKEATQLIQNNIARYINHDFLLKPKTAITNFVSRAFNISPKIK